MPITEIGSRIVALCWDSAHDPGLSQKPAELPVLRLVNASLHPAQLAVLTDLNGGYVLGTVVKARQTLI